MALSINLLPAKGGDCIHLRFNDSQGPHNIIIDSGPSQNKRRFKALLEQIRQNQEQVDLLCLSHIDDDHIEGAKIVLAQEEAFDSTLIREVWFNVPVDNSGSGPVAGSTYHNLSADTAQSLYNTLMHRQITVRTELLAGMQFTVGEALIEILSPNQLRHDAFSGYWEEQLAKKQAGYGADSSVTNGDSIAFILSLEGRDYLFLGDAHAPVLSESLGDRYKTRAPAVVKLSHHGSKHNINSKLLRKMNACCFLISSEEDAPRPSQETIDLLEQYEPEKEKAVYCNFACDLQAEKPEKLLIHNLQEQAVVLADGTNLYSEGYDD